jgi:hypothetical protein
MNNMMVRKIGGAKINPKSSFKNYGAQNTRGRKLREQMRYIIKHKINSPLIFCLNTRFLRTLPSCFKFPKVGNNMAMHEQ